MTRKPCCNGEGLKKGTWTEEEDKKLIADIQEHGKGNWHQIPPRAGLKRCGKSCRLRWYNYLKPNIKRGDFTDEEDKLIIKLHLSCGNKWSVIARQLPGRTDNEIKNYWNKNLKKLLIKKGTEAVTESASSSGFKNCPNSSNQSPSPRPPSLSRDAVSQPLNSGTVESPGRNENLGSKKGYSRSSSTSRLLNKMATMVTSLTGLISANPPQIQDNSLIEIDNVISPSYDLDSYNSYPYEGVTLSDSTYNSVPVEIEDSDFRFSDVLNSVNAYDVQDALSTSIEEDAFAITEDWSEFVIEQPGEVMDMGTSWEEFYNNDERNLI